MENNDQKFLSHFGVPGMKWGQRRSVANAARAAGSVQTHFERKALVKSARSDTSSAYAKYKSASPFAIKKGDIGNAQAKSARLGEESKQASNMAKGSAKAAKLVSGMNMKQAVKTMEAAAGYSKGKTIAAKLLMSNSDRLVSATTVVATKITNGGRKEVD